MFSSCLVRHLGSEYLLDKPCKISTLKSTSQAKMFSLNALVETSKEDVCKRQRELDENDVDSSCDSSSRSGSDDLSEFVQQDEAFVDNTDYDTNDGFVVADDDHDNMMMLETDDDEADEEETDEGQDESTDNKQRSCIFTGDYREAALALFGDDEADASDSDDSDFDCDTEASSDEDSECDVESWSGDDDDNINE